MEQDFDKNHWNLPCPKIDCRKKTCECGLQYVFIPANLGDDGDGSPVAPKNGEYCNALVEYEANGAIYIYSADGVPVMVTGTDPGELDQKITQLTNKLTAEKASREAGDASLQEEIDTKQDAITTTNKLSSDLVDDSNAVNKFVSAEQKTLISSAVQPDDINYTVMTDLDVDGNPSTSVAKLDASQVNLASGTIASKDIPLPVASATQAGVMNSATFNAVTNNSNSINALLNGAVAVTGLSATPTQAELTAAWQNETGLTTLINRAQIYDATNSKIWTYYTNDDTWHEASAGGSISISTFTNNSEGTIRGSTNVGQVFAENDGTGSVNGWDSLSAQVTNNTNNLIRVGSVLSQPSSVAYVDTNNIVDEAVARNKINFGTLREALWTNADPSANFSAQTITVNLPSSSLDFISHIEVIALANHSDNYHVTSGIIPVGDTFLVQATTNGVPLRRKVTANITINGVQIVFGAAEFFANYNNSSITTRSDYIIPVKIIGYSLYNDALVTTMPVE